MAAEGKTAMERVLDEQVKLLREDILRQLQRPLLWDADHRPVYGPTYSREWLESEHARKERLRSVLEGLAEEWGVDLHDECWPED